MSDDYERLAKAIVDARKARQPAWTQEDLVAASGLSRPTIQRLEKGDAKSRPTRGTVQAIERALGWLPGSVEAVLKGGMPAEGSYDGRFLRIPMDKETDFVRDLVRKITLEIDPDTPMSRVVAAEAAAEAALREAGLLPPLDKQEVDESGSNS